MAVHPLLGPHVRLQEEPERHVWQAEVGTKASPWLADHQIHGVPALPGAAYCEMALTAARAVFGEASEVRDIRFEQMLLLDAETTVGAVASVETPAVAELLGGDQRRGHQHAVGLRCPACRRRGLSAAGTRRERTAEQLTRSGSTGRTARVVRQSRYPIRTGLHRSHRSAHRRRVGQHGPRRDRPARARFARNQGAFGVHPALLDACFQSVAAHPGARHIGNGGLLLPLGVRQLRGYGPARDARYCYARVTASATGLDADLDLIDAHGAVLLTARGLQMGTGASESSNRDRLLGESLLTIEWQPQALPASSRRADRKMVAGQHLR